MLKSRTEELKKMIEEQNNRIQILQNYDKETLKNLTRENLSIQLNQLKIKSNINFNGSLRLVTPRIGLNPETNILQIGYGDNNNNKWR